MTFKGSSAEAISVPASCEPGRTAAIGRPEVSSGGRRILQAAADISQTSQLDLFVPELGEVPPKSDMATLEHPIFTLSKSGDTAVRVYERDEVRIEIIPSTKGCPTIWDKAILVYVASRICSGLNKNLAVNRHVVLSPRDLLLTTGRGDGGGDYKRLLKSLERLRGVTITTSIRTGGVLTAGGFGLIENYALMHSQNGNKSRLDITLSEWLYRALLNDEVLTLDPGYFKLSGGLERRLYEIVRKHCGKQSHWKIGFEKLRLKSGSRSSPRRFKFELCQIVGSGIVLLGYVLTIDATKELLLVFHSGKKGQSAFLEHRRRSRKPEPMIPCDADGRVGSYL